MTTAVMAWKSMTASSAGGRCVCGRTYGRERAQGACFFFFVAPAPAGRRDPCPALSQPSLTPRPRHPLHPQQVRLAQRPGAPAAYRILARCPRESTPPAGDAPALAAYFNASASMAALARAWAHPADPHFTAAAALAVGARVLDQDPLETLLAFICSSNNSIGRIQGMVAHLAATYGEALAPVVGAEGKQGAATTPLPTFHAFPTLAALAAAVTEADLRGAGFGYRARYISGTVAALAAKPGGGEAWLEGLRSPAVPAPDAVAALATLPGVGPKVAACVALLALRKPGVVPVDTHVWALAQKHYTPGLKGKALSPAVMAGVEAAFVRRFGEAAGWAQTVLFVADLPAVRKRAAAAAARAGASESEESGESDSDSDATASPPRQPSPAARADRLARRAEAVWAEATGKGGSKKRAASSSPDMPTPRKVEGKRAAGRG